MAIQHNPRRWDVLDCNFGECFKSPEMVKKRLVIVIAEPEEGRQGLCTVVPLSATEPEEIRPFHHEMSPYSLPDPYRNKTMWAKCDMVYTVGFHRLDRVKIGKNRKTGKRIYHTNQIILADIQGVTKAILHGLKLDRLTPHI